MSCCCSTIVWTGRRNLIGRAPNEQYAWCRFRHGC